MPLPVEAPNKASGAGADAKRESLNCAQHSFSCDWPRLSERLNDLKKLFSRNAGQGRSAARA